MSDPKEATVHHNKQISTLAYEEKLVQMQDGRYQAQLIAWNSTNISQIISMASKLHGNA